MPTTTDTNEPQSSTSNGLERRAELYRQVDEMMKEIKAIESSLHMDNIDWMDHVDGTNCDEWRCGVCGERWWCPTKQPCPKCFPQRSNNPVCNRGGEETRG